MINPDELINGHRELLEETVPQISEQPLSDSAATPARRKSHRNSRVLDDLFIEAGQKRQSRILSPHVLAARRDALQHGRFPDGSEVQDLPALKFSQDQLGYRTLDFTTFDARFIEIAPLTELDSDADLVRCRLLHRSLLQPPHYVALSYNWGNTSNEAAIVLNDVLIPLAANLEAALRELRRRGESVIWCDFLSLNPCDDCERNFHLLRSAQIFSKAAKVIAWLGPEADDSNIAMSLLQEFDISKRRHSGSKDSTPPSQRSSGSSNRYSALFREANGSPTRQSSVFEAMDALFQRPYFQRAWILQEIGVAEPVELLCGSESASLEAAEEYLNMLKRGDSPNQIPDHIRVLFHFRSRERRAHTGEPRMSLLEAFITSKLCLTADPRDKIFALLPLTRDSSDLVPTPNYIERAETAYLNVIKNMVSLQGHSAAVLLAPRAVEMGLRLPTWAPNWNGLRNDAVPPWIINAILERRDAKAIPATVCGNALRIRAVRLEQILSMSGQKQSLTSTHSTASQPLTRARLKDALITLFDTLTALCEDIPASQTSDTSIIFALKTYLFDHDSQSRIAEINRLSFFHRNLQDWVEEYCEGENSGLSRQAAKSSPEYKCLKQAFHAMAQAKMKLAITGEGENLAFRIVYRKAHVGDWVWRIHNCSLPVILRLVGPSAEGRHQYVGEVFLEDLEGESHWTTGTGWETEHFDPVKWDDVEIV